MYLVNGTRPSRRNLRRLTKRLMKDETGDHGGSSSQQQAPDNSGGNGGTQNNDSPPNNNGGQQFDYSAFWNSPEGGDGASPRAGESADSQSSSSGQPQGQQTQQPASLGDQIKALQFGGIFNDEVMGQMAEGNTEGFHKNMTQFGQQVATESLRMMIPLMQQVRDQLREEMKSTVQGNNQTRDNDAALLKAIPSASDPRVRPMVDNIFNQALKHTKGNRDAALSLTKDMFKIQMDVLSPDMGVPPPSAGDNFRSSQKIDWMEELAGRS